MDAASNSLSPLTSLLPSDLPLDQFGTNAKERIVLKSYYKSAIQIVESKLSVMNEEYFLAFGRKPIQMITSRIKKSQSVLDKMIRHQYPLTVETAIAKINDIAGVRAICAFEDDVYHLADVLLKHADITLLHKKDYIAAPKANGYRSLHLILSVPIYLAAGKRDVKVEVQLRTLSMDFWAGIEHELRYKQKIQFPPELDQQIRNCADLSAQLDAQMANLHKNLSGYVAAYEKEHT